MRAHVGDGRQFIGNSAPDMIILDAFGARSARPPDDA
jgi:hypothetical protein